MIFIFSLLKNSTMIRYFYKNIEVIFKKISQAQLLREGIHSFQLHAHCQGDNTFIILELSNTVTSSHFSGSYRFLLFSLLLNIQCYLTLYYADLTVATYSVPDSDVFLASIFSLTENPEIQQQQDLLLDGSQVFLPCIKQNQPLKDWNNRNILFTLE